jgi:hypothetical protein
VTQREVPKVLYALCAIAAVAWLLARFLWQQA